MFPIDILVAHFVQHPDGLTLLWRRTFGDILSDLGPACTAIGIAPSGNINPERIFPSLSGQFTGPQILPEKALPTQLVKSGLVP